MKIMVTGAPAFIGMHFCKRLLERGDDVLGVDVLNNYYDVTLKLDRFRQLKTFKRFQFIHADIADSANQYWQSRTHCVARVHRDLRKGPGARSDQEFSTYAAW